MTGAGAMVIVTVWLPDAGDAALSCALSVIWKTPEALGVPVMVPTAPLSVRPAGRLPLASDHV